MQLVQRSAPSGTAAPPTARASSRIQLLPRRYHFEAATVPILEQSLSGRSARQNERPLGNTYEKSRSDESLSQSSGLRRQEQESGILSGYDPEQDLFVQRCFARTGYTFLNSCTTPN
jgi:hypothetical protein